MAISSGVAPHRAWLQAGGQWPIEHGHAEQTADRSSGTFNVSIPLSYPGAEAFFSTTGATQGSVVVSSHGITDTLLTGELDECAINYINRTINVTGRDASAQLHQQKSSEKWQNKKGEDIISDLAGRVGLGFSGSGVSKLMAGKLLMQDYVKLSDNVSFGYIIQKLAEFDGARWFVKGNTLHYVSKGDSSGVYTINYSPPSPGRFERGDFLNLEIVRNLQASKTIGVQVQSWHPKDKRTYTAQFTIPGIGGTLKYNYNLPNLKQDHVEQYAQSRAQEHARHGITVHAHLVGDPSIDIGMGLQLNGTGYFDGPYTMDSITHEFGMHGHTMTIIAKLPDESSGGATVGEQVQGS